MAPPRVALVAEDRRLLDFVRVACERLADEENLPFQLVRTEITRGCRRQVLQDLGRECAQACDLLVLASDVAGRGHDPRKRSARRKAQALKGVVGEVSPRVVCAVADPCVEAWMLADPRALAQGLGTATGQRCTIPSRWPRPRTEVEGKTELGRVVRELTGSHLPLSGLEFAAQVVSIADLRGSPSPSLAEFAQSFLAALRSVAAS